MTRPIPSAVTPYLQLGLALVCLPGAIALIAGFFAVRRYNRTH